MAQGASKTETIRTLKQRIGTAVISKADKANATSTLYHRRDDGTFAAVEINGIVKELVNDYLYVSILKPVSILGRMDGDKTTIITGTDARAFAKARADLAEVTDKPKAPRGKTTVAMPDAAKKALEKAKAAIPDGYRLAFDKNGEATLVKIRTPKGMTEAPTEEPVTA